MAQDRVEPARAGQSGFTMIEVLVAILLTALTLIGVLGLFRIETRAASTSRRETEAAVLAQDKLEELRTQLAPSASVTGADNDIDVQGNTPGMFDRTWSIAPSADPAVYNITVTVSWDDDGYTRSVEMVGQRGGT